MKKKILLALAMIAMLTCLLAISVSAEYDKSEAVDVTLSDGTTQSCALYDAEGNALVWYTLDSGATVVSVKTSDLLCDTNGSKLVDATDLKHIYLADGTALQKQNDNTTNKIMVANLRDCTFKTISHSSYKTTFYKSTLLQYVYLPNTITTIGCNIFMDCANLKVCDIPSDATFAITDANNFPGCTSLRELNLYGCTRIVGHSNFKNCKSLTKVIINPEVISLPTIDTYSFQHAPLTQFGLIEGECTIPASTTVIANAVFENSRFSKIVMPDGITSIGYNAFSANPNLLEVNIPSSLSTAGIRIFKECTNLSTVTGLENCALTSIPQEMFYKSGIKSAVLPSTCTVIAYYAFRETLSLTSVTIPAGFTLIDDYAFYGCTALTNVIFLGDAGENAVIDQAAFEKSGPIEEFYIPEGVVTLGNCLFNQAGVKRLSFPSTLTTISGNSHFEGSGLVSVTGFENTKITTIPNDMFKGQKNWKADVVRIPDTVTSIGMYGMADVGATKFILGTGMQTIGTEAFVNCPNVKEVYIPDTVTSITSNAFNNNKTSNILFFVTSSDSDYLSLVQTGVKANAANIVSYADYSANPSNYLNKGRYVISGVNKCVAFYEGKHTLDASQSGLSYPNGFNNKGVYSIYCTQCEESFDEEKNALLVVYGTSVPEFVGSGIAIGFEVDKNAIKEYEDATGTTVVYGLFAVLQARITENDVEKDIFSSDGTAAEGVMFKEVTALESVRFAVKIVGFKTETHKAAKLAMGAYLGVISNGEGEYQYMQGGTPNDGEKYYYVSYNDLTSDITE